MLLIKTLELMLNSQKTRKEDKNGNNQAEFIGFMQIGDTKHDSLFL